MAAADRAGFDPVDESFSGFEFGELAFGALGVLAITSEHGNIPSPELVCLAIAAHLVLFCGLGAWRVLRDA